MRLHSQMDCFRRRPPTPRNFGSMYGSWIFGEFDFHPIAVLELVLLAQPQVRRDLDDVPRVMTNPLFIQIRAQEERRAIKDPAWNKAYRYAAAILMGFEPDDVGRKRIF